MTLYAYLIDYEGFITNSYVVGGDVAVPDEAIMVQLPQPAIYYVNRWKNGGWTEGASPEEIEELIKPEERPPSLGEQLAERDSLIEGLNQKLLLTGQLVEYNSAQQQELLEILIEKGLI